VPTLPIAPGPAPKPFRILVALASLLGVLATGCRSGPKSDLEPGKAVEREIGGTEVHSYRLPFDTDSYVSLRIWQPSVDVTAKLVGPKGETLAVFDDPNRMEDPDRFAWIANKAGMYRLTVRPKDAKSARGRYRIEIREFRGPESDDADRLVAEREYEAARSAVWAAEGEAGSLDLARFQKALRIWERLEDAPDQADALVQIANNFERQVQAPDALTLARQALQLAQKSEYREGEARALHAVGNAYDRMGSREEAIRAFKTSAGISRSLRSDYQLGVTLYSLGMDFYRSRQYDPALRDLEESRQILTRLGDLSLAVKALINISYSWEDQGEVAKTLQACEEARSLSSSLHDPRVDAIVHFCFGNIAQSRGEWGVARQEFEQALKINQQLKDVLNQAYVRQALGSAYFNLGDTDTALSEYTQALEANPDALDLRINLLTNIGWVHQSQGDPQSALSYYQKALSLHDPKKSRGTVDLTLHDAGVAYTSMGRPQEGLKSLQRALKLRTDSNIRRAQAVTLLEIGTAYSRLGDARQAEGFFRDALTLARTVENTSLQAECLFRWAALESSEGKLSPALEKIKESLGIVESLRSTVLSNKLKTTFFASKRAYYELYMDILMRLEEAHSGNYREQALEASERARARALLDLLAEGHINVRQGISSQLKQRESELQAKLSDLQQKIGKAAKGQEDALERQLDELQADLEDLGSQIRTQYQHYAEVRYPTPLSAKEIQGLLDDRTALLQYFTGRNGSFLFVVTRQGLKSYRLPPREDLAIQVTAFRRALRERGRRQYGRYQELATRLYAELIAPADGSLRLKDRLLIAPDGPLYFLPFEALLADTKMREGQSYKNLPYLLRRFSVSYIPSASVLKGLRAPRPMLSKVRTPKRFIGFADPVIPAVVPAVVDITRGQMTDSSSPGLQRLTESGKEVEKIAALYPKTDVALYTGMFATEDRVKDNGDLKTARQIDFATHGIVNEARPELSSLELTPSPGSDGKLTVYEIFNLQLGADLVTLSACETGLGAEVSGEGIIGLTRAFFYAGAKSLVVSLWPVADRSTSDLIFSFYHYLGSSNDKAEALRRAKLAMIQSGTYSEPYYWAPFILSGEPR
jgi:CHAT domain-containing protein/tetratricopeptide (TPR) repeat protein